MVLDLADGGPKEIPPGHPKEKGRRQKKKGIRPRAKGVSASARRISGFSLPLTDVSSDSGVCKERELLSLAHRSSGGDGGIGGGSISAPDGPVASPRSGLLLDSVHTHQTHSSGEWHIRHPESRPVFGRPKQADHRRCTLLGGPLFPIADHVVG